MFEDFLFAIGNLFLSFKNWKWRKKRDQRRKLEKEENLPKKIMISPSILGLIIVIFISTLLYVTKKFNLYYFGKNKVISDLQSIHKILDKEKKDTGKFPEKIEMIKRNNPLRTNIDFDIWGNQYFYQKLENGDKYILISKGKDGILYSEDDIKLN